MPKCTKCNDAGSYGGHAGDDDLGARAICDCPAGEALSATAPPRREIGLKEALAKAKADGAIPMPPHPDQPPRSDQTLYVDLSDEGKIAWLSIGEKECISFDIVRRRAIRQQLIGYATPQGTPSGRWQTAALCGDEVQMQETIWHGCVDGTIDIVNGEVWETLEHLPLDVPDAERLADIAIRAATIEVYTDVAAWVNERLPYYKRWFQPD